MQTVLVAHDTAWRTVVVAPAGVGVAWIVHVDPSKRSASPTGLPLPPTE
jgi:hypothetical protein